MTPYRLKVSPPGEGKTEEIYDLKTGENEVPSSDIPLQVTSRAVIVVGENQPPMINARAGKINLQGTDLENETQEWQPETWLTIDGYKLKLIAPPVESALPSSQTAVQQDAADQTAADRTRVAVSVGPTGARLAIVVPDERPYQGGSAEANVTYKVRITNNTQQQAQARILVEEVRSTDPVPLVHYTITFDVKEQAANPVTCAVKKQEGAEPLTPQSNKFPIRDESVDADITIRVAKSNKNHAGKHRFRVWIQADEPFENESPETEIVLDLEPYYDYAFDLVEREQTIRRRFWHKPPGYTELEVVNYGNDKVHLELTAKDRQSSCNFEFTIPHADKPRTGGMAPLDLPVEKTLRIPLSIWPPRSSYPWLRKGTTYHYTVAASRQAATIQQPSPFAAGELHVTRFIPRWLQLLCLVCFLLILGWLIIELFQPAKKPILISVPDSVEPNQQVILHYTAARFSEGDPRAILNGINAFFLRIRLEYLVDDTGEAYEFSDADLNRPTGKVPHIVPQSGYYHLYADSFVSDIFPSLQGKAFERVTVGPAEIKRFDAVDADAVEGGTVAADVVEGGTVAVGWEVKNAEWVRLLRDGEEVKISDSNIIAATTALTLSFKANADTTFELQAGNRGGAADPKQKNVTVRARPCTIVEIFAHPEPVTVGDIQTISWTVAEEECTVDIFLLNANNIKDEQQLRAGQPYHGDFEYRPQAPGDYLIKIQAVRPGPEGTPVPTARVPDETIHVRGKPTPPPTPVAPIIESFTSATNEVVRGQPKPIVLEWKIKGEWTKVELSKVGGGILLSRLNATPPPPQFTHTVDENTVFVLTAYNGTEYSLREFQVVAIDPTLTPTAPPPTPLPPGIYSFAPEMIAGWMSSTGCSGDGSRCTWEVSKRSRMNLCWYTTQATSIKLYGVLPTPTPAPPPTVTPVSGPISVRPVDCYELPEPIMRDATYSLEAKIIDAGGANTTSRYIEIKAIQGEADLEVEQSTDPDKGHVVAGRPLTYIIKIKNIGPAKAYDVTLTDDLPSQVPENNWTIDSDGLPEPSIKYGKVTWPAFDLAKDDKKVIKLTATLPDTLNQRIDFENKVEASVGPDCDDPKGSNNKDSLIILVDAPPVAQDDNVNTDEDRVYRGNVMVDNGHGTDSDADTGDTITVSQVNGNGGAVGVQVELPSHALLRVNADGAFEYNPNGRYESLEAEARATDSFTYQIADRHGGTDTATVTVTINGVDDLPVAVKDTPTVDEDADRTTIDVLANDTDVDGGSKVIATVTPQPGNGTVVITNQGRDLTYQPAANYCNTYSQETDDFNYELNGGSSATVKVTVNCVDDPPVAVEDTATVDEDADATQIDVLANDTDVDGGLKTIQSVTPPGHGTVVITNQGLYLTYQPAANYCNFGLPTDTDNFNYTLNGGSPGTVKVTVNCTPDRPVAVPDNYTATMSQTLTVRADQGLLLNDSDPDNFLPMPPNAGLIAEHPGNPTSGNLLAFGTDGSFTYEPGNVGSVTFTYQACDSLQACSDDAIVTITVTAPGGTATADQSLGMDENTRLLLKAPGVSGNKMNAMVDLETVAPFLKAPPPMTSPRPTPTPGWLAAAGTAASRNAWMAALPACFDDKPAAWGIYLERLKSWPIRAWFLSTNM